MFEFEVTVEVRLNSGAQISLTPDQHTKIKNFTIATVLGEATKEKQVSLLDDAAPRKYQRRATAKRPRWTEDEDKDLARIVDHYMANPPSSKGEISKALQLHRITFKNRHTQSSVANRYYDIRDSRRQVIATVVGDTTKTKSWVSLPIKHDV